MAFDDRDRNFVPKFNGDPTQWNNYKDEVRVWLLAEKQDVDFCLAARLVRGLSGIARRVCLKMTKEELSARPATETTPADMERGVNNVLNKLEEGLGMTKASRKGTALDEFLATRRFWRLRQEPISSWLSRCDLGVSELHDQGVDLRGIPDILGWYLLPMANLDSERRERVVTAWNGDDFPVDGIRVILLRIFADLHRSEGRPRVPYHPQAGRHRQALEAHDEAPEDDGEPTDESFEKSHEDDLADELDASVAAMEYDDDMEFTGEESQQLEEATATLAGAREALAIVRAARAKMGSRKGKGKGKSKGKQKSGGRDRALGDPDVAGSAPAVAPRRAVPRGTGRGRGSGHDPRLQARKAKSRCVVCGQIGHWQGDPERCGGNAFVVDDQDDDDADEVCLLEHVVSLEFEAFSSDQMGMRIPDGGLAIVDTACARSVAGEASQRLRAQGLQDEVEKRPWAEKFRFGDGRRVNAEFDVEFPAVVAGLPVRLRACIIPGSSLPYLLGRDFFEQYRPDLLLGRRRLRLGQNEERLGTSSQGHLALDLRPQDFRALQEVTKTPGEGHLPRRLRDRSRPGSARRLAARLVHIIGLVRCAAAQGVVHGDISTGTVHGQATGSIHGQVIATDLALATTTAHDVQEARTTRSTSGTCPTCSTHSSTTSSGCGSSTCVDCLIDGRCAGCAGSIVVGCEDDHAWSIPQRQEWRRLKQGTARQLDASLSALTTLQREGVHPGLVRNVLNVSAERDRYHAVTGKVKDSGAAIIEYCAEKGTYVSEIADRLGVKSNIFGLHNADLSKIAGTRLVTKCIQKHLDQGRRVLVWASLPCTPWCLYHRIREPTRGPDARRRLASARTHSLLMVRRFLSVVKRYADNPSSSSPSSGPGTTWAGTSPQRSSCRRSWIRPLILTGVGMGCTSRGSPTRRSRSHGESSRLGWGLASSSTRSVAKPQPLSSFRQGIDRHWSLHPRHRQEHYAGVGARFRTFGEPGRRRRTRSRRSTRS